MIRDREADNYIKHLKEKETDKERWGCLSLYSYSGHPENLKMPIIKSIGLEMRLDPEKGHLIIEKPGIKQAFQISSRSDTDSTRPKYGLKIMDASENHAIIRMFCYALKNRRNEYYRSTNYFLYDMQTADMRSIWSTWVEDKDIKAPYPNPTPTIKKTTYGYQMDWTGINENDPERKNTASTQNTFGKSIYKPESSSSTVLIRTTQKVSLRAGRATRAARKRFSTKEPLNINFITTNQHHPPYHFTQKITGIQMRIILNFYRLHFHHATYP